MSIISRIEQAYTGHVARTERGQMNLEESEMRIAVGSKSAAMTKELNAGRW